MTEVSLRQFAREMGCALSAVQKADDSGRISAAVVRNADGTRRGVLLELGRQLWIQNTDPSEAAKNGKDWGALADRAQPMDGAADDQAVDGLATQRQAAELVAPANVHQAGVGAAGVPAGAASVPMRQQEASEPTTAAVVAAGPAPGLAMMSTGGGGQTSVYYDARARREQSLAELAELELQEKQGLLMRVAEVERETFELFRGLRDRLLRLPYPEVRIILDEFSAGLADVPAGEAAAS